MRIVTEVDGQNVAVEIGPNHPVIMVGRLRECDLVVKNPSVSRRHCKFSYKNGMVELEDMGSSAGCWVNGERVQSTIVDAGDDIKLGNQPVRIEGGDDMPSGRRSRREKQGGGGGGGGDLDSFFSSGVSEAPEMAPATDGAMVDPDAPRGGGAKKDPLDDIDFSLPEGGRSRRRSRGGDSGGGGGRGSRGGDDSGGGRSGRGGGAVVDEAPSSRGGGGRGSASGGGSGGSGGGGRSGGRASKASDGAWELVWDDGGQKWPISPNDAPKSVGRKAGVDILIPNPTVGRKHATVGFDGDKLQIVDLKSSNGTYVNGKRIRKSYVKEGDVVGFGSAETKVVCRQSAASLPEPIDDWDEWGDDDDWGDETFEMQPPSWHLVWMDADKRVTSMVMDLSNRVLAVGSAEDCEISVPGVDGLDAEHVEMTWDQGALVVRDLGAPAGTHVNGRSVDDEQVLRNHDVVRCGELRIQIIRGTQGQPAKTHNTEGYQFWAPVLEKRDDSLSLTFIEYDSDDPDRRRELTLWGDGMGSVEKFERSDRTSVDGQATQAILEPLCMALMRGGFPEAPSDNARPDEEPPELECYFDGESAVVTMTKKTCGKSEHYAEALELLKAILHAWDPVG